MNFRHLEIFCTVCAKESFTLAADASNVAQPAVSIAIQELETYYGCKLFERMNRRIYITESGKILLQYAQTILSQREESLQVLKESQSMGSCHFGVHVSFGEVKLSAILTEISQKAPWIDVRVYSNNSRKIEQMILENRLDFVVTDHVTTSSHFVAELLNSEALLAVCSPSFSAPNVLSIEELATQKLLLRESGSGIRNSVDAALQAAGCTASPVLESISTSCLLSCAKAGFGITILPESLVEKSVADGSLKVIKINSDLLFRRYYILSHKNKYHTRAALQVMEIIRGLK